MTKKDRTQIALDRLGTIKSAPLGKGEVAELKKNLLHRSNYVVGKACDVVAQTVDKRQVHEISEAFETLFKER